MSKSTPSSVTAEEAVARMVNMDYIPEGFTLEDMLSAFREEAEVEHENAQIDCLPGAQIESLKVRLDACEARRSLAILLLEDLRKEASIQDSAIVLSPDSSSIPRYTLDSVADWVTFKYGIGIPEWSYVFAPPPTTVTYKSDIGIQDKPSDSLMSSSNKDLPNAITWEDIEIRIRKGNIIAYSFKKGDWIKESFAKIGLLNKTTQQPNHSAGILIGLSVGEKYPPTGAIEGKHKTAISRLRNSLRKLTGIESEPFTEFNEADGWKPLFKLTDDRKNADNRAKKAALHEQYNDGINYDDEDDKAGKFIRDNR